jgi:hypothetical protein
LAAAAVRYGYGDDLPQQGRGEKLARAVGRYDRTAIHASGTDAQLLVSIASAENSDPINDGLPGGMAPAADRKATRRTSKKAALATSSSSL